MKDTSAVSAPRAVGLKFSAICRTIFARYTGYGKAIPSALTFATSAPRPPSGPPPATGGFVTGAALAAFGVAVFAVRAGAAFAGAVMRSGTGFSRARGTGAGAGAGGTGTAGAGVGCTTPI